MDIKNRLTLAGTGLLGILEPDHELMPTVDGFDVAHDLGRWWDAVLRLEEVIGFTIPAELEAASLRNLKRLTENPFCLLMSRKDVSWLSDEVRKKARIFPHNYRETFIAYEVLIRRRNSSWARKSALELVASMDSCMQDDGSFDLERYISWGKTPLTDDQFCLEIKDSSGWFDSTQTSGRALEALVWLYEATGDMPFFNLATRIAELHYKNCIAFDGSIRAEILDANHRGHNHSYQGTLRGLLLYGLLTDQKKYVDAVANTYRNSIRYKLVRESGWTPHDLGRFTCVNAHGDYMADPASAGDSAQIALWLALRVGHDDLLDDVERIVRARLLPAQLTHDDIAQNPERTFATKDIGAWTINDVPHAGKRCLPDVHAAVTHTLCDIQSNIVTQTAIGLRVNLHFDYEDENITIKSTRDKQAKLSVCVKCHTTIMIRIPAWAPEETLGISVDGNTINLQRVGVFALIPVDILKVGSMIELLFDLPEKITTEELHSGTSYRFKWRGDEIIGVDPQDTPMHYYQKM